MALQDGYLPNRVNPEDGPTFADVDAEKERRLGLGMSYYNNYDEETYVVQIRDRDMIYVGSMATFAMDRRANYPGTVVSGYIQWLDFTTNFALLDIDDNPFNIDAFEIQHLMLQMTQRRYEIITAAQTLKNMELIPSDYTDDSYWPDLPV